MNQLVMTIQVNEVNGMNEPPVMVLDSDHAPTNTDSISPFGKNCLSTRNGPIKPQFNLMDAPDSLLSGGFNPKPFIVYNS